MIRLIRKIRVLKTRGQTPVAHNAATPFNQREKPFKNAPSDSDGQGDGKRADASEGVLEAFAKDTSKAAEAVRALLDDPTPEKVEQLLADLPSLLPEDPALAAVIAEAMAAEFRPDASAPAGSTEVKNAKGVCTSPNGPARCKSPSCPGKGNGKFHRQRNQAPSYVPELDEKGVSRVTKISNSISSKALADRSFVGTGHIGFVPSKTAILVAAATKGPQQVDIEGFKQVIPAARVRHAANSHGEPRTDRNGKPIGERRPDQIPLKQEDYDRIGLIMSAPQSVKLGTPRQGMAMIQYTRSFEDGELTVVCEDAKSQKQVRFYDMWKRGK